MSKNLKELLESPTGCHFNSMFSYFLGYSDCEAVLKKWQTIYSHWKRKTNLSSFPFDFSRFRNRISALVYIKLFGEGFVLEVWILIKILQKKKHLCHICTSIRYDIYNVYVQSEPDDSQNLFYIQTWYPRTRWPPPLTSNEVLPRPPPPEELKLQQTSHPKIRPVLSVLMRNCYKQGWLTRLEYRLIVQRQQNLRVYLVDGWQMLWPRSWGFWLWVLIASGRMAGVVCCTFALLLKFLHWPVHWVWRERRQTCQQENVLHAIHISLLTKKIETHLSISFCTSSMCSIASCCSFSGGKRKKKAQQF